MNLINVYNTIVNTGGATYNINTGELDPTSGFIVSLVGFEKIVDIPKDLNEFQDIMNNYLQRIIWDQLMGRSDIYLGFWINADKLIIDLSERFEDRDGAILAGYKRGQKTIYNANMGIVYNLQSLPSKKVSKDRDIETDKKY